MRLGLLALLVVMPISGCFGDDPESQKDPPPGVRLLGCPAFETTGRGVALGVHAALLEPPANRSVGYRELVPSAGLSANVTGLPAAWTNASMSWIHHGPLDGLGRSSPSVAADGWVRLEAGLQESRLDGEFPAGVKAPAISKYVAEWLLARFELEAEEADAVALDFVATRTAAAPRGSRQAEASAFRHVWSPGTFDLALDGNETITAPEPRLRQVRVDDDIVRFSLEGRSLTWVPGDRVVMLLVDPEDQAALRVEGLRPPTSTELPGLVDSLLAAADTGPADVSAWKWATREIMLARGHALCKDVAAKAQ